MGTGPFAVPTCEKLLALGHDVPLVVVRPIVDPTAKKRPPAPVRDWATGHGLPVFDPKSINAPEAIEVLAALKADLLFVCDYGQILSNACLSASSLGGINLHGSLLPRHRGAAPVQWALLRGDSHAGVSVIHMTPRLDAGPILSVASTPIGVDEDAGQLEPRLAQLGVGATVEAIGILERWDRTSPIGLTQNGPGVTKAPRFAKMHGQLDFRLPAEYLVRLVRALQPWPGTFAELSLTAPQGDPSASQRILIRAARALDQDFAKPAGSAWACESHQLGCDWPAPWKKLIAVATGQGTFVISRLQPSGKREMTAEEFLRGHNLQSHAHFLLPDPPAIQLA